MFVSINFLGETETENMEGRYNLKLLNPKATHKLTQRNTKNNVVN